MRAATSKRLAAGQIGTSREVMESDERQCGVGSMREKAGRGQTIGAQPERRMFMHDS